MPHKTITIIKRLTTLHKANLNILIKSKCKTKIFQTNNFKSIKFKIK